MNHISRARHVAHRVIPNVMKLTVSLYDLLRGTANHESIVVGMIRKMIILKNGNGRPDYQDDSCQIYQKFLFYIVLPLSSDLSSHLYYKSDTLVCQ